jgi:DNA-directed RNA polymerase specialized sigma24 family protein
MTALAEAPCAINAWDVSTRDGFFACHRATVRELCAYAGLLAGPDRAAAEQIVRRVYAELAARAQRGDTRSAGFGVLRRAVRHEWLTHLRDPSRVVDQQPAVRVRMLAELPAGERTVVVVRLVDEMSVAQTSEVIGVTDRVVETLFARGLARLGR